MQKVGTIVLVAFVIAALVGLVGFGPLASTSGSSPDGLVSVGLDRVTRLKADNSMTVTFTREAVEDGTIRLELTGPWTSGVDLQGITPEPSVQQATADGVVMMFQADPSAETDVSVSFTTQEHLMLEEPGRRPGRFRDVHPVRAALRRH